MLHKAGARNSKQGAKKDDSVSKLSMSATEVADVLKDFVVALDEKRYGSKSAAERGKEGANNLNNVSLTHGLGGSIAEIVNAAVVAARNSFNDGKLVNGIKEAANVKVCDFARNHMKSLS